MDFSRPILGVQLRASLPVSASRKLVALRRHAGKESAQNARAHRRGGAREEREQSPLAGDGEGRGGLRGRRRLGLLRPVLLLRGNQGHLPRVRPHWPLLPPYVFLSSCL